MVTIDGMGKKKATGGAHKTPRKPVQLPTPWLDLARILASKRKQPTVWLILALLGEAAEAEGLEHPAFPWEMRDDADADKD